MTHICDWVSIQEKISNVFSPSSHSHLHIDICLSVSLGRENVTLASKTFFDQLKLRPNYMPLLSDAVLNLNIKKKDGLGQVSDALERLKISKMNFYSTFKTCLPSRKLESYNLPCSTALLMTKLFGCWIYGSKEKFKVTITNLYDVLACLESRPTKDFSYRIEARCKLRKAVSFINMMKVHIVPENFSFCKTDDFFRLLDLNLKNFSNYLCIDSGNAFNPDSLIKSMISESIINNIFLSGSRVCSVLPSYINSKIISSLVRFENNLGLIFIDHAVDEACGLLVGSEKKKLLENLIKYASGLSAHKKHMLSYIPKLFYAGANLDFAETLINAFVVEMSGDATQTYSVLTSRRIASSSINFSHWVNNEFTRLTRSGRSSILRCLFNLTLFKRSMDVETLVQEIKDFVVEKKIVVVLKKVNRKTAFNYVSLEIDDQGALEERARLLQTFQAFNLSGLQRISPSTDEMVRYFNAFYKYRHSSKRLEDVLYDFSYSFYPARNLDWIKNRIQYLKCLVRDRQEFEEFIIKVKEWTPDKFTLLDRLTYLESFDIFLKAEEEMVYSELIRIDNQEWSKTEFKNELLADTCLGIFKSVVWNAKKYNSVIETLKQWDVQFDFSYINNNTALSNNNHLPASSIGSPDDTLAPETIVMHDNEYFDMASCDNNDFAYSPGDDFLPVEKIDDPATVVDCDNNLEVFSNNFGSYDFLPQNILLNSSLPELVCPKSLNSDNFVENILFKKYRYCQFNSNEARKNIFKTSSRIDIDVWNSHLEKLIDNNVISKVEKTNRLSSLKFNLKLNDSQSYLTFEYIMVYLKKRFSSNCFTISASRLSFTVNLRPKLIDWKNYLDDLVTDRVLTVTPTGKQKSKFLYQIAN